MIKQTVEILSFGDEKFVINESPFDQYLQKINDTSFKDNQTSDLPGCICSWLIYDGSLYLTKVEGHHTLESLFSTSQPVLADWFTGTLKYNIDESFSVVNHERELTFVRNQIDAGRVTNTSIVVDFEDDCVIGFGKYNGLRVSDVLGSRIRDNPNAVVQTYLNRLLRFLTTTEVDTKLLFPYFKISPEDKELIKQVRSTGMDYFLGHNFVAIRTSDSIQLHLPSDAMAEEFCELFERLLKGDFGIRMFIHHPAASRDVPTSLETMQLSPDTQYLEWAINTVEKFALSPLIVSKPQELKRIERFEARRLGRYVIEFVPIFEKYIYNFPYHLQDLNSQKFERLYGLKVDSSGSNLTPAGTTDELQDMYGFYLNGGPKTAQTVGIVFEEDDDDYDRDFYDRESDDDYDSNDWLIDAAGTDDPETMNDVYWNLD